MSTPWSIRLARALFLLIAVLLGAVIAEGFKVDVWYGTMLGLGAGLFFILVDALLAQFTFREFSSSTFGLMVGLFCGWLIKKIGIFDIPWFRSLEDAEAIKSVFDLCVYVVFGFLGITLALRSDRDQFSFIIPYVRFRRDASEGEPILVDTQTLIDGRIPKVYVTGFLTGSFVIPRFVLEELQSMADSSEVIRAEKGKRGLDCIQKLREIPETELTFHPDLLKEGESAEAKLVQLSRELNARLLTHDTNLSRVADLRNIRVLNFNDLANALEPELKVGDEFVLELVKPGKDKHQAVGYLPDGTMIVVNQAANFLGEVMPIVVSGSLQTSAGRLVFAELNHKRAIGSDL